MNFAERLKMLRESKGLKQQELANLLFLKQSTISAYERNKIQPTPDTLNQLADFFNVTVDYLLGRPNKEKDQFEQVIDTTIDELKNEDTLLFMKNGEIDEETARLLKIAMKNAIKTVDDMKKGEWNY